MPHQPNPNDSVSTSHASHTEAMPANTKKNPSRAALTENRRAGGGASTASDAATGVPPHVGMLPPGTGSVVVRRCRPRPAAAPPAALGRSIRLPRMAYDVARIRSEFPSLDSGWAQFDGPGGTQTPRAVGEAVASVLTGPLSNRGTIGESEERAEEAVHGFRLAMADLVDGHPRGIVHGRSATQLTYDFSRTSRAAGARGDEVVVTRLDHDSNVRPWVQAAERVGATVRWVDFDPATGELADRRRRGRAHRPHPARRRDRGVEPHRHDARHPGDRGRRARRRRAASTSTACTTPRTSCPTSTRSAPTSSRARRTSSSARTAACSPRSPSCSRRSRPTSCCRRRTRCPSDSSSARCPTSCSPGATAAVDVLAGLDRPIGDRMSRLAPRAARRVVRGAARARGRRCARASRRASPSCRA